MPTTPRLVSRQQGARVTVQAVNWSVWSVCQQKCKTAINESGEWLKIQQGAEAGRKKSPSLHFENYGSFPFGIVGELMQQRGKGDPGSPRVAGLRLQTLSV